MKYHNIEQGHKKWFDIRMGKPTASELSNLLTPEFEIKKGETPKTYTYMKVAEAFRGKPLIFQGSWATEQGQVREEEAVPFLSIDRNWKIENGGFIETDDELAGCSPDGIVNLITVGGGNELFKTNGVEPFGIEVKCPEPPAHVRYLVEGVVPKQYITQVHGGMYVTGWKKWVFCSYHRDYPPLVIEVERDEKIIAKISEAVTKFHEDFKCVSDKIGSYL